MGKVLHNLFKTYNVHLLKLQKIIANNKSALIGNENVNVTNSTASNLVDKLRGHGEDDEVLLDIFLFLLIASKSFFIEYPCFLFEELLLVSKSLMTC